MSREEQFDFYWKEIFDGLPYNPIEFNVYRFDQSMSLPSKFNKLYEMFKQLALNNQEVMDYLKEFVETFDFKLETTIKDVLIVWLNEGLLADVVREAINEEVIEARTDYLDHTYLTLKERLDLEREEVIEARTDYLDQPYLTLKERLDLERKEVILARGVSSTLKDRLDSEKADVSEQLSQNTTNIKVFGAKGNANYWNTNTLKWYKDLMFNEIADDDTQAIQSAVDYAQSHGTSVYIPSGTYLITSPIILGKNPIRIIGNNFSRAIITTHTTMTSMFLFDDIERHQSFEFSNIRLRGMHYAEHGIKSENLVHSVFDKLWFNGFNVSAISLGNAWSNDIIRCRFEFINGDGIAFTRANNHMNNIHQCKFVLIEGFGIKFNTGRNLNITDCQIQNCAKGGVFHRFLGNNIVIKGCYFEGNGADGWEVLTPFIKKIRANIILNGDVGDNNVGNAYPLNSVSITDNSFFNVGDIDCDIYGASAKNVMVYNNTTNRKNIPLIETRLDGSRTSLANLDVKLNGDYENLILLSNFGENNSMPVQTWKTDLKFRNNLATNDFSSWKIISGFQTSSIQNTSEKYYGNPVGLITLTVDGSSHRFGMSINLDEQPELKGKYYYFSVWVKQSSSDMGATIILTGSGRSTPYKNVNTDWRELVHVGKFGETGTVSASLQLYSGKANDTLKISKPVLTLIGTPSSDF